MSTGGRNGKAVRILIGGILGMVVVMGIGRFAYTPILPLMQRDLGLSHTAAGWLAGWNYLGYLVGAVAFSIRPGWLRNRVIGGAALGLSILTTWGMGATTSMVAWGLLRLVGGVTSAMVFIIITAEVSPTLLRRGHGAWTGALFSGVGLGIASSGWLVPQLDRVFDWRGCWQGMGILAGLLAGLGLVLGRDREPMDVSPARLGHESKGLHPMSLLSVAYFLEGLGYVVTATFVVAIITNTSGLEALAPYSWVVVGLAAVPATVVWPHVAARFGNRSALIAAFAMQGAGMVAGIQARTAIVVLGSAAAFGGTFLGIVALVLAEGRRRFPHAAGHAAAVLTASFGLGQMLGPVVAGRLADHRDGFQLPLGLAAGVIFLGGILIAVDPGFRRHQPSTGAAPCPT